VNVASRSNRVLVLKTPFQGPVAASAASVTWLQCLSIDIVFADALQRRNTFLAFHHILFIVFSEARLFHDATQIKFGFLRKSLSLVDGLAGGSHL
jgi:hypothetical protein